MLQSKYLPYVVLFVGVCIAATSSILARLAQADGQGAPSMVIAGWRLIIAAAILTPIAWRGENKTQFHALRRRDLFFAIAAGVLLAAHLSTWISSLEYTSVASAAALVSTHPLWVALAVFFFFGERLSRTTALALIIAFCGSLLIAFSDGEILVVDTAGIQFNLQNLIAPAGKADTALFGDMLALIGAITVAAYLLVGRNLRIRLSNTTYVWLVYTAAMVTMVTGILINGDSLFNYSWIIFLWILLLGLGPQLLGHTAFNWTLALLSATFVALASLGEPIGSAILAWFIFDETFQLVQLIGFALLLTGIALGVVGEQNN